MLVVDRPIMSITPKHEVLKCLLLTSDKGGKPRRLECEGYSILAECKALCNINNGVFINRYCTMASKNIRIRI